jgi:hypothetical protein
MEKEQLTPSESLALITRVIAEARSKFRDNGFSFILLGICTALASIGQFFLLQLKYYKINYYPYFIMPLAGLIVYFYYARKRKKLKATNVISSTLSLQGIIIGLNFLLMGFFFWDIFGISLFPVMFVLIALWLMLTGALIGYKTFIISGIFVNVIAYVSFFINRGYHALILTMVSVIALIIPGVILKISAKKNHV